MKFFRLLLLPLFLLLYSAVRAQEDFTIHIFMDKNHNELGALLKDKVCKDSIAAVRRLDSLLSVIRLKGYLLAEIDTLTWDKDRVSAFIKSDQKFFLAKIETGNVNRQFLNDTGFKERLLTDKPFNIRELERLFEGLLQAYGSQGWPFASVRLDSVQIRDSLISARLYADQGRFILIDSIYTAGNALISNQFIQNYLHIKPGQPYNESAVNTADEQLGKLSFLEVVKPAQVGFSDDKASLTFFLNKKNSSRFDGILGLAPRGETGKLLLTGNITLQLQNAFRNADQLGFHFQSFGKQGRELDLHFSVPFIFSSPLGIAADFDLYKQDTSFQNVNFRGTVLYNISALKKMGFYIEKRAGNIFTDTADTDKTYADINSTLYGLTYRYKKLDNEPVPIKGIIIGLDGSAGFKRTRLPQPETDRRKSSHYRLEALLDLYIPAGRHSVFRFENQSALLAGRKFYENELYRIGGFGLLRGFDERSVMVDKYSVFNAEYRYMIEQQSFLFLFWNQGFISRNTIESSETDAPLGFGAGINLETKAGILSLTYALGKQKNIPVNLRQGKIHFGLTALF